MKTIKFPIREEIPDIKESDFNKYLFVAMMIEQAGLSPTTPYIVINYCVKTERGYKLFGVASNSRRNGCLWQDNFLQRHHDQNLLGFLLRFSNEMNARHWDEEILMIENQDELMAVLTKHNIESEDFISTGKDLISNLGKGIIFKPSDT